MYISMRMEDLFNRPTSSLRHIAGNRHVAGNPLRLGLSPSVTQAVKVVNAIFHLIIKDWGRKTTQSIGKQV